MVYTSYFGNVKRIKAADPSAVLVAVCGGLPPYWKDGPDAKWLKEAAPKREWWQEWKEKFKDDPNSEESVVWYKDKYEKTVLMALNPCAVDVKLLEWGKAGNVYLLCYEKAGEFCHRRLLAEWLNRKLGLKVEEADHG